MLLFLSLLTGSALSWCGSLPEDMAKAFMKADRRYNIEAKLLLAISETESGCRPNCVSVYGPSKKLTALSGLVKSIDIKTSCSVKGKMGKMMCSFYPNSGQEHRLLSIMDNYSAQFGISYDVGLMQINSKNAERLGWDKKRLLDDYTYNIDKAGYLLRDCFKTTRHNYAAIECYNKGHKSYYSGTYLEKVMQAYERLSSSSKENKTFVKKCQEF